MEKYYTPKLEEFCIGFEYEFLDMLEYSKTKDKWVKNIVSVNDLATMMRRGFHKVGISQLLKNNRIRVKCLDKEDIESFGFKVFHEPDYQIHYMKDNISVHHYKDNKMIIEYDGETLKEYKCYFEGYIKNKSEFKKLIEQIFNYGK
jgi:hypothetical protein